MIVFNSIVFFFFNVYLYIFLLSVSFINFPSFNAIYIKSLQNLTFCPKFSPDKHLKIPRMAIDFNAWLNLYKNDFQSNINLAESVLRKKFNKLRQGMDQDSIEVINYVEKQIFFMFRCNFYLKELTRFQKDNFEQWKVLLPRIRHRYKLQNAYYPEVFLSLHGLRYANQKILNYISKRDILDIGACKGESIMALYNYTHKKIYSYEYDFQNYRTILNAISNNHLDESKIIVVNKAISNETKISIHVQRSKGGPASHIIKSSNGSAIEVTTVDFETKERNITVGFMKADIEGYELKALEGARETISRDRPVISISIYHHPNEFFGIKEFINQFPNYKCYIRMEAYTQMFCELSIFAYPKELD